MTKHSITIHDVCHTTSAEQVHVKAGDTIRWSADHAAIFYLNFPGGFFAGEPDEFQVLVLSTIWTKEYKVDGKPGATVRAYIYDSSGQNCQLTADDGPPEIIIDSGVSPKRKAAAKKKAARPKRKE